jgi:xylulokinase
MDNDARGAFIGLSAIHTRRDLLRAVMEGVTYALRQNVETMRSLHVKPKSMLACGGGAKSAFWRQMMADVFRMPVKTVHNTEGPALGAAILGGVAAGIYADVPSACEKLVRENEPLLPDAQDKAVYARFYDFFVSLYPALKDSYKALSAL